MTAGALRTVACALLLCLGSLGAAATTTEHVRGEFRFTVGPEPAFVQVREVAAAWPGFEGSSDSDPWRHWLMDRQVDRRDGSHVSYEDRAFQALSPAQVGDAAKYSISFSPLFQTLTLHRVELRRDGDWLDRLDPDSISLARRESGFEQNLADGEVTALVVLDDVRAGDVVRIAYTVEGSNPIMEGNTANYFLLGWTAPILSRTGRALYDLDAEVATKVLGGNVEPVVARRGEFQEISISAQRIGAIRDAGGYPNWFTPFPMVQVGPARSWADIVAWARPLYPEDAEIPAELEARLQEWRELADPYAQAGAVLRAMQDEVRYFGVEMGDNTHRPNPPSVTWARRYGDCKDKAYLAVMLLRKLGMDAEPALASISDGRAVADYLPAASAFDHVIVHLKLDGRSFWLDPTLSEQRGDIRQLDLYPYGVALPVSADSKALLTLERPDQVRNELLVVEHFIPDAAGTTVDLKVEARYRGAPAESVRRRLQSRRFDQLAGDFADYYRKRYGELEIATPTTVVEDVQANTVVFTEHYRLADALDRTGGSLMLGSYAETLSGDTVLPSSMSRNEPLGLSKPGTLRHEVRIDMPPGWVLSTLPGALEAEGGPMSYRRELSQDQRRVSMVHELEISQDHVAPADLPEFLAGLRQARDALGTNLSFGLPTELRSTDRERRLQELLRGAMDDKGKQGNE